jgi:hypothetical protein
MPKLLPLKDFGVERVLTKEGFALRRPAARLELRRLPSEQTDQFERVYSKYRDRTMLGEKHTLLIFGFPRRFERRAV